MEAALALPEIVSNLVEHVEYGALTAPVVEPISRYVKEQAGRRHADAASPGTSPSLFSKLRPWS